MKYFLMCIQWKKLPLRMHLLFMMKKRLTYVLISTSAAEMRKKQSRIPST